MNYYGCKYIVIVAYNLNAKILWILKKYVMHYFIMNMIYDYLILLYIQKQEWINKVHK